LPNFEDLLVWKNNANDVIFMNQLKNII